MPDLPHPDRAGDGQDEARLVAMSAEDVERLRLAAAQLDQLDAALIYSIQERFRDGITELDVSARCGKCEGELFMLTCHHVHGTDHEWALASICVGCHEVHWFSEGCHDCTIPASELPW